MLSGPGGGSEDPLAKTAGRGKVTQGIHIRQNREREWSREKTVSRLVFFMWMNQLRLRAQFKGNRSQTSCGERGGVSRLVLPAFQGADGTYVEVVVRRFGLEIGSHYGRDLAGATKGLTTFSKSENVEDIQVEKREKKKMFGTVVLDRLSCRLPNRTPPLKSVTHQ